MVETYTDRHSANGAWQYSIPTDASEKTMDWKMFLGDAPKHDFDPVRFFRWRNYQDYGTGVAGDLFVHLFSGLHVVLDSLGPEKIYAAGGLRYWKDGRDVPDVMLAVVDYPQTQTHAAFNLQIRVNFVDGGGGRSLLKLVGSEGTMVIRGNTIIINKNKMPDEPGYGGWDTYETFSVSQQESYKGWYEKKYPKTHQKMADPGELVYNAPRGYDSNIAHHNTFYSAIRNGTPIVEDASFGLRTAGPSLATNISYFEKRIVSWDAKAMEVS
jgi:predicted dehydrogenase